MAEGFYDAQASKDLKHMLKISHGAEGDLKKKNKANKTKDTNTNNSYNSHFEFSKYADLLSETFTNSSDRTPSGQPSQGSTQSDKKGDRGGNSNKEQPALKRWQSGKDHIPARYINNDSTSREFISDISLSISQQKDNSNTIESLEVVNSDRRSSALKNRRSLKESGLVRNADYKNTTREDDYRSRNKNVFTSKNQRKNSDLSLNSDEGVRNMKNTRVHDTYRNENQNIKRHTERSDRRNGVKMNAENENNNDHNSKSNTIEPEELTKELLDNLQENKVQILKKRIPRFFNARYYCEICDFYLCSKSECEKHLKDYRHIRKKKLYDEDEILRSMPEPTEHQFEALTAAVEKVYEENGISEMEKRQRADIVLRLERLLKEKIPDVLLFMYGSSLTGFGLKTSDINVDLTSGDKKKKLTFLLKEAYLSLKDRTDTSFSNVRSDFTKKMPGLLLVDNLTGLTVNVTIHCYNAHCSSELLSIYSDFDLRIRKLAVVFRFWAHICGLDRHCDGFIPPQAFNLMVIYFLQVINPQLAPIIEPPKITGDEAGDFRVDAPNFEKRRAKLKVRKDMNNMSLGELWFRLLWFYCLEFDFPNHVVCIRKSPGMLRNCKPWNNKRLAVEDPYLPKRNVTCMVSNTHINEHWENSLRMALCYFGLPRDAEGKSDISIAALAKIAQHKEYSKASQISVVKVNKQSSEVRPSTQSGKMENVVPSMNVRDCEENINKKFSRKKEGSNTDSSLEVSHRGATSNEGGEILKLKSDSKFQREVAEQESKDGSLSESDDTKDTGSDCDDTDLQFQLENLDIKKESFTSAQKGSDAVILLSDQERLSASAAFWGKQASKPSNSNSGISVTSSPVLNNTYLTKKGKNIIPVKVKNYFTPLTELTSKEKAVKQDSSLCKNKEKSDAKSDNDCIQESVKPGPSQESNPSAFVSDIGSEAKGTLISSTSSSTLLDTTKEFPVDQKKELVSLLAQKGCQYDFSEDFLTDGKGPVLVCTYCEQEGHLKIACPDDKLPDVLPLPSLTPLHVQYLSETLNSIPSKVGLSPQSLKKRINFMKDLEEFIQVQTQFKDASLTLFGSSCNGFGFKESDMDISLTFSEKRKIDKPWLIETLARKLKQNGELENVQAISTAKVPIVKFQVRSMGLEGDISLYNILAQQNTKLLLCYSEIDPRVQILGYTIKNFAKVCDIGDASRGSLSSYAYILMMIHFLQQVSPPVVPVLQELYEGKEKPQLMIEDSDAWFMDDLAQLENLWPEKGKNKMSVAELWLGFLRFYVEEFNYKELVVCIRQKDLLTRFEKMWNGESIAIEDPFNLNHNLGSGLSKKMNNFIFRTFINCRMLCGSPIDDNLPMFKDYPEPYDYFFNKDLLSENRPPNSRGCHQCGKIGHLARLCPIVRKEKEDRRRQKREQKQLQREEKQQKKQPLLQQQKQTSSSKEEPENYSKEEPENYSKEEPENYSKEEPENYSKEEPENYSKSSQQKSKKPLLSPQQEGHNRQQHERQGSQQKQGLLSLPLMRMEKNNSQSSEKQQNKQPLLQHEQAAQSHDQSKQQLEKHPSQQQQRYQQQFEQKPLSYSLSKGEKMISQTHKQQQQEKQPLLQEKQPSQQEKQPSQQERQHSQQERQPSQPQPCLLSLSHQKMESRYVQSSDKQNKQHLLQHAQAAQSPLKQIGHDQFQPESQYEYHRKWYQHEWELKPPLSKANKQQERQPLEILNRYRSSSQSSNQRIQPTQPQKIINQPQQHRRQSPQPQQLASQQLAQQSRPTQKQQRPNTQYEHPDERPVSEPQHHERRSFFQSQQQRSHIQSQHQQERPPSQQEQRSPSQQEQRSSSKPQYQDQRPFLQPQQLDRSQIQSELQQVRSASQMQNQQQRSYPQQQQQPSFQHQPQQERPPSQPQHQQERPPSQSENHQEEPPFAAQHHPNSPSQQRPSSHQLMLQPNQSQQLHQQQPLEWDLNSSKQEQEQWPAIQPGNRNMNSSSSPGKHLPTNFDTQGIQPTNMQTGGYSMIPPPHFQQNLQYLPRGNGPHPVISFLGGVPPPFFSPVFPRFSFNIRHQPPPHPPPYPKMYPQTPPNSGSSYPHNDSDYPHGGNAHIGSGYPHGGSGYTHGYHDYPHNDSGYLHDGSSYPHNGIGYPQGGSGYPQGGSDYPQGGSGYPQGGSGYPHGGSGHPHGGSGRKEPQFSPSKQNSNQGNEGSSSNIQFLNPVVQRLFEAGPQALNAASTDQYHRHN